MLQDAEERVREEGMSVWSFLEHVGAGRLLRVTSAEAFSLALDEVFLEMYHNVLKRVSSTFPSSSPSCHLCSASSLIALLAFCFSGIHVEKGARTPELDRALVRVETLYHGLLRRRGFKGKAGGDAAGQELCCGGGRRVAVKILHLESCRLSSQSQCHAAHTSCDVCIFTPRHPCFSNVSCFLSLTSFSLCPSPFRTERENAACSVSKPTVKPLR